MEIDTYLVMSCENSCNNTNDSNDKVSMSNMEITNSKCDNNTNSATDIACNNSNCDSESDSNSDSDSVGDINESVPKTTYGRGDRTVTAGQGNVRGRGMRRQSY